MAYEGKKHQRAMGLTNTVEVSSRVQRLLISAQHNASEEATAGCIYQFSSIRESSSITEECFNTLSLLLSWVAWTFTIEIHLPCWVQRVSPCVSPCVSLCVSLYSAQGWKRVVLAELWSLPLVVLYFSSSILLWISWRRRVMESRQGWKAWEISAMHRQLQWAQNPRTFTFSNWMTL